MHTTAGVDVPHAVHMTDWRARICMLLLVSMAVISGGAVACKSDRDAVVDVRQRLGAQGVSFLDCPAVPSSRLDTTLAVVTNVRLAIRVPAGTAVSASGMALAWKTNDGLLITVSVAPERARGLDALLQEIGTSGALADCVGTSDFSHFVGAVGPADRIHMGPGKFGTARWFLKDGRTIALGVAAPQTTDTVQIWQVMSSARFSP